MAVVDLNTQDWFNSDGLQVFFGAGEALATRGGEFCNPHTGEHITEVYINLATLPTAASGNEQIVADNVVIPAGAFIKMVSVFVTKETTTGGSPNLDLGLVRLDRTTEIDFNGLLADADAFENAGTDLGSYVEYIKGTTEVGALVGTRTTLPGLISASPSTADWTAGVVRVQIHWFTNPSADL